MTRHQASPVRPVPLCELGPATPLASVQGTLALDLGPRTAPPPLPNLSVLPAVDGDDVSAQARRDLDRWAHRFAQAAVEIVGGDRPATQLLRWTSAEVYADLQRRAVLVARAAGRVDAQQGPWRSQPVRPQVVTVRSTWVSPTVAETSARVRYGPRSRALALRFEQRAGRWMCRALEFA